MKTLDYLLPVNEFVSRVRRKCVKCSDLVQSNMAIAKLLSELKCSEKVLKLEILLKNGDWIVCMEKHSP